MKNSSEFISDSVYRVNKNYSKLQNKTEELFFQCLDEGRSIEYFIKKLDEIWGNIDHSYMNEQIDEYINIIHENNMKQLNVQEEEKQTNKALKITSMGLLMGVILNSENKYKDVIKNKYNLYYNSPEYKNNKEEYLKKKLQKYDNNVIPYYVIDKITGEVKSIRYVKLSTYLAMKYNTQLTRAGWERTLEDAEYLGYEYVWIPPHAFSCKYCIKFQGELISVNEARNMFDVAIDEHAEEQQGDILHPNCKCELKIYTPLTKLIKRDKSKEALEQEEEYYHIREKVLALTLKKDTIKTDMKIANDLGFIDVYDKLNQKRNVINSQIRDLIDELPTEELKKKVVAINR